MNHASSWNAATVTTAVAALPFMRWSGHVWRVHRDVYSATDPAGSLIVSGRYNKGADRYAPEDQWPALYTAAAPDVALAEAWRYIDPDLIDAIKVACRSEMLVDVSYVLDCRDVTALGLSESVLLDDWSYDAGHVLGRAAVERRAEALLVPSATRLGDILVIFTENLRPDSQVRLLQSQPLSHLRRAR